MKNALITGVTGQDGAYLTSLLLSKGYKVYGLYRRSSTVDFWRLSELGCLENKNLILLEGDLADLGSVLAAMKRAKPNEVYNLAAQSFVGASFHEPVATTTANSIGTLNVLEAIRLLDQDVKFYQASTSEMFGMVQQIPQTETTPFYPRSPYGVSKLYAHWITINYRESYDIFATSGILFNHESPLRGTEFATRKISKAVAEIYTGRKDLLELGNLDAKRDWGYAKEYVEGMWKMLQHEAPDTYILATNQTYSVRDFVIKAFNALDIDIGFEGSGLDEMGFDKRTGKALVKVNEEFYRPAEVDLLIGDYSKAKEILGWEPKTSLSELCDLMVRADLAKI